jgi:hypothetical protein
VLKLRGTSLAHALDYLRNTYGDKSLQELLQSLPEPWESTLSGRLMTSRWYEAEGYTTLLKSACAQFTDGDPELVERISAYDMEESFAGPYRALFRFGPANMVRLAALVWRFYYNQGKLVIAESAPGFVRARLEQFQSPDPILCRNELTAGFVKTIELSGGKDVRGVHTACVHEGAEVCTYELTWS